MRSTPVTYVLLVAIGLVFLLDILSGRLLIAVGANDAGLVGQGQWWRLATSILLHVDLLHLAVNGWALYQLGGLLEMWVGSGRLLGVFCASGLAGSLASVAWTQGPSAGASGAIFGLLGALMAFLFKRRDRLTPAAKSLLGQLAFWAAINVVLGFTVPQIDNAAHLGGCAAGLVLGSGLRPSWDARRRPAGPGGSEPR